MGKRKRIPALFVVIGTNLTSSRVVLCMGVCAAMSHKRWRRKQSTLTEGWKLRGRSTSQIGKAEIGREM